MTKGKELFIKNLFMFIKEKRRSLGGEKREVGEKEKRRG